MSVSGRDTSLNFHIGLGSFCHHLRLPKTNSSHLKIGHPKRKRSYSNHPFSSANCHVSFSEGKVEEFFRKTRKPKLLGREKKKHQVLHGKVEFHHEMFMAGQPSPNLNVPPRNMALLRVYEPLASLNQAHSLMTYLILVRY